MRLLLLISLFFHAFLFAQEDISSTFSYIQVENKNHTFDEIKEKSEQGLFSPLVKDHSKFGFNNNIFWIKVHVINHTNTPKEQILELNHPALDTINIYEVKNDMFTLAKELGDLRPYDVSTFMPNPNYTFSLLPLEEKIFFVQITSTGSLNIGISLEETKIYNLTSSTQIKWLFFYFGAVIMMLMYNFLIYLMTQNKSFLYYVLFHFTYIIFALGLSGFGFQLLWPDNPYLNQYIIPISMSLTGTFSLLFAIHFLNLRLVNYTLSQFLYVLAFISFLLAFVPFIYGYSLATIFGSIITFLIAIILFILSLYLAIYKKNINALFYFVAWSFYSVGVVISHLSNIGIIPSTMLTSFASQIGSFVEVLLLSLGLAYYYSRLKSEHSQLTFSNDQLRLLSHTDMLTNSHNRRYFNEQVKQYLIETAKPTKEDVSLLMLDLDYFKRINDNYGHDIGDKVLISFVDICQSIIRKDDIFARFGGEEFVLFLPHTNEDTALSLAKEINIKLSQYTILSLPELKVTVSIGISCNIYELEKLLHQADKALYKAKNAGRNTLIVYDYIDEKQT